MIKPGDIVNVKKYTACKGEPWEFTVQGWKNAQVVGVEGDTVVVTSKLAGVRYINIKNIEIPKTKRKRKTVD